MIGLGRGLDIKVNYMVHDILAALEKNRDAHVAEYAQALEVYFRDMELALQARLESAAKKEFRKDSYRVDIPVPVDAQKMYDQYIRLFTSTVSEEVELSPTEYIAIMEDEWDWAVSAKVTNSYYTSRF